MAVFVGVVDSVADGEMVNTLSVPCAGVIVPPVFGMMRSESCNVLLVAVCEMRKGMTKTSRKVFRTMTIIKYALLFKAVTPFGYEAEVF